MNTIRHKINETYVLIKEAGTDFKKHNAFKLSASLAFFSMFFMAPMLLVIIFISGIFFGKQAAGGTLYAKISDLIGEQPAMQVQTLIKNAMISNNSFMAVAGFVMLIIAATTFFMEVQGSLNMIWNLKLKSGRFWKQLFINRLLSFCIVAGLGLLLLLSLVLNSLLDGFKETVHDTFPGAGFTAIYAVNLGITMLFVTLLYSVIYKVLPHAILRWKETVIGAFSGAILFMIGRFALSFLIGKSDLRSSYGGAGSLVIILIWIFYSAITLYFGAVIAKTYALRYGARIMPKKYAYTVKLVKLEEGKAIIRENEMEDV